MVVRQDLDEENKKQKTKLRAHDDPAAQRPGEQNSEQGTSQCKGGAGNELVWQEEGLEIEQKNVER